MFKPIYIMRPYKTYFLSIDIYRNMNLQEVSHLLSIDFSEMKLQSGFNKLSKINTTLHPIISWLSFQIMING